MLPLRIAYAEPVVSDATMRHSEERYTCSANGLFEVTVAVPAEDFSRTYRIGRPSGAAAPRRTT